MEDMLQKEVKEIQKVKNYDLFFQRLGFPAMKHEKLNEVLAKSVVNSKTKNYHGGMENAFPLPEPSDRVLQIIKEDGLL